MARFTLYSIRLFHSSVVPFLLKSQCFILSARVSGETVTKVKLFGDRVTHIPCQIMLSIIVSNMDLD